MLQTLDQVINLCAAFTENLPPLFEFQEGHLSLLKGSKQCVWSVLSHMTTSSYFIEDEYLSCSPVCIIETQLLYNSNTCKCNPVTLYQLVMTKSKPTDKGPFRNLCKLCAGNLVSM